MTTIFAEGRAEAKCDVQGCTVTFSFPVKQWGGIDFAAGTVQLRVEGWAVFTREGKWHHVCKHHNLKDMRVI